MGGVYWSQQTVSWSACLCNVMSQTPPTVFKSSKLNLLHMIPMNSKCGWSEHGFVYSNGMLPVYQINLLESFVYLFS